MKHLITNTSVINLSSFVRIKLYSGYRDNDQKFRYYIDLCCSAKDENILYFTYDDKQEQLKAYKEILEFMFNSDKSYLDWHDESEIVLNDVLEKNKIL